MNMNMEILIRIKGKWEVTKVTMKLQMSNYQLITSAKTQVNKNCL